ncbi:MAG: hypothetical protein HY921_08715 [Elusimicrobia bacterium]|nr:hypothetical protein [Elusimicrobiota bacterium]
MRRAGLALAAASCLAGIYLLAAADLILRQRAAYREGRLWLARGSGETLWGRPRDLACLYFESAANLFWPPGGRWARLSREKLKECR